MQSGNEHCDFGRGDVGVVKFSGLLLRCCNRRRAANFVVVDQVLWLMTSARRATGGGGFAFRATYRGETPLRNHRILGSTNCS